MIEKLHSLVGKTALITGASSGLGAHFAKVLSEAGATVVLAARREEKLVSLVAEIFAAGGNAHSISLDVTHEQSIVDLIEHIGKEIGVIDILINNAGVAETGSCLEVEPNDWDFVMNTNLKGAWRVATLAARHMVSNKVSGSIVNIASILGLRVGKGQMAYATSKAAVVQMTKGMALELGPAGIRVNALCPGYFRTEINDDFFATPRGEAYIQTMPAKRLGNLDELNGPLLLLASEAGSFINGIELPVDGGHLVSSL